MRKFLEFTDKEKEKISTMYIDKDCDIEVLSNLIIQLSSRRAPIEIGRMCFFGNDPGIGFIFIGYYAGVTLWSIHVGVDLQFNHPIRFVYAREIPEGWNFGDKIPDIEEEDKII